MPSMEKNRESILTIPDLVILGLLHEKPMHGYDINRELKRRDVQDWASVSRAQVYYSLKKMNEIGVILEEPGTTEADESRRQVFRITEEGRALYRSALKDPFWSGERAVPRFMTWAALSLAGEDDSRRDLLDLRLSFLKKELEKEKETLDRMEIRDPRKRQIVRGSIRYMMKCFEAEIEWIESMAGRDPETE